MFVSTVSVQGQDYPQLTVVDLDTEGGRYALWPVLCKPGTGYTEGDNTVVGILLELTCLTICLFCSDTMSPQERKIIFRANNILLHLRKP